VLGVEKGETNPPKPVSASAMSGTLLSKDAIMPALATMSFKERTPRSGIPNLEAAVPAPVYDFVNMLTRWLRRKDSPYTNNQTPLSKQSSP
jgi:hypothetical protein